MARHGNKCKGELKPLFEVTSWSSEKKRSVLQKAMYRGKRLCRCTKCGKPVYVEVMHS